MVKGDEDMTSSNMTIDYKVSSFQHVHGNFWYTSLGSTCVCHYLIVGTNASQSAIPSKLNIWFAGRPTILHWEGITLSSGVSLGSMGT